MTFARPTRLLPALLLALAAACAQDLSIDDKAKISCTGECPEGWTCNPRLGRCIPNDAIDTVPPSLVAPPVVTPAVAPLGSVVTVSFDVNEALRQPPAVTLDVGAGVPKKVLTLDAAGSSGNHWVFTWPTVGDEPQLADCNITLSLEDLQGLETAGLLAGSVRFDFIPPGISGAALSGSPAGFPATLRLAFHASEPPVADPIVHLGSGALFLKDDLASTGLDYVYEYLATGAEAEDLSGFPVTVDLADAAGHHSDGLAAGTAVFDRTPPFVVGAPTATPAAAADGALVRVTFQANEPLLGDPTVMLGEIAMEKGSQVGTTWSYGHVALAAEGDGDRPLSFQMTDLAGNTSLPIPGPTIRFDFQTPAVSDLRVCLDDGAASPCASDRSTFSAAPAGRAMKISFTLSENAERLDVTVGGTSLVQAGRCAASGLGYVCTHVVTDPLGGASPRVETDTVAVAAIDAAGNSSFDYRWITYDFLPPAIAGSPYFERCDGYAPARVAANDLWVKRAAAFAGAGCPYAGCGLSGPVRVHFSVDENVTLVGGRVTLDDGTPLTVDTCASSATQFVAVLTGDGGPGTRTVRAEVQDAGGNVAVLPIGTLRLDYTAPGAPDTATDGRIVYERYPWGARATGGARSYFLRGAAGAVAANASVVALDGSSPALASEIGRTTASATGAFGGAAGSAAAFEVVSANLPEVYVAQEDPAGNVSPVAPVWDGAWTATLGGKQRGNTLTNPNLFYEQPMWRAFRDTTLQREPVDPSAIATGSGRITTAGQPGFEREWTLSGAPAPRGGCAMTWDPARAQGVFFGGYWGVYASAPVLSDETWLWNGRSWVAQAPPVRPQGRWGHGLAQDKARDRTVLFGGCTAGPVPCTAAAADTWEYDGEAWKKVCWPGCSRPSECSCTQSPAARYEAALFWDDVNGEIVLFGGASTGGSLGDMWAWDGTDWRVRAPGALPAAGAGRLSASDPVTGTTIVSSGTTAWIWNGASWSSGYTSAEAPGSNVWFDAKAGRFRGHTVGGNRLLEWGGASWTALASPAIVGDATSLQSSFNRACGAWDAERAAWIRFGGCVDDSCRADYSARGLTFAFRTDGAGTNAFVQVFPGNSPDVRHSPAMAWNPASGTAWLHGGKATSRYSYDDDWQWNGLGWLGTRVAAASGGAYGQAMCQVDADKLVRFGGQGYGFPGGMGGVYTWYWEPSAGWHKWAGAGASYYTQPITTNGALLADQSIAWNGSEAIFFRGEVGGATTWGATYSTNLGITMGDNVGVKWTPKAPTTVPTTLRGQRLAYCSTAGGLILFGGFNGTTQLAETWSWNGSNWVLLSPATSPPAREGHAMFCDPRRGKLYVVGGTGPAGVRDDVWEFNGSTWTERFPIDRPVARYGAGVAFHDPSGRAVLFGGYGTEYLGDTWTWDGGRDGRPAQVFRAAFGAAGVWGDAALRGVDAAFTSGATAGGTSGVTLSLWDRGQWRAGGAGNTSSAASPGALAWSTGTTSEWTSMTAAQREARLRRLFTGDAQELSFAVLPGGTNSTGSAMASVATDYAEVTVRYELRCRAAGSATTDPSRCCSSAATGGTCN
jgi:hypothetical protein